jgi:hypothetical protein
MMPISYASSQYAGVLIERRAGAVGAWGPQAPDNYYIFGEIASETGDFTKYVKG